MTSKSNQAVRAFHKHGHPKGIGLQYLFAINSSRIFLLVGFAIAVAMYKKSIDQLHEALKDKGALTTRHQKENSTRA